MSKIEVAARTRSKRLIESWWADQFGKRATSAVLCLLVTAAVLLSSQSADAQSAANIYRATLMDAYQAAAEVSTAELQKILADNSAVVIDARPFREYAVSHIPGAVNVSARAGVPISSYVSDVVEVGRLLNGNKTTPIVLYCNGPFCGKIKRLASELSEAGYTNVRRYQLGIPVWRALGGLTEIEREGLRHVISNDRTAVFIDAGEVSEFRSRSAARARNIPASGLRPGKDVGEIKVAKDDGRLPMEDHNTRIIVFGRTAQQAKAVAEAIAREAFHNVSYFDGSFSEFRSALRP